MGIDPGKSVYFCYTTMGARNHMTEYQQIIHCRWCDEPVDDSGSDFEQDEDAYLYLNMINYRLIKLLEIHKTNESFDDFNVTITKMRPPIFWKDKPVYLKLLKRWHKQSILEALEHLGHTEEKLKKNSSLNSLTMVKNSILNICSNSWAYF